MYMYRCIDVCMYVYVYIYIYICMYIIQRREQVGKGQTGSALMGSLRFVMFFDRGTFWVTSVNLRLSSKKCQGVPFSPIHRIRYFCSDPISVDLICPQANIHIRIHVYIYIYIYITLYICIYIYIYYIIYIYMIIVIIMIMIIMIMIVIMYRCVYIYIYLYVYMSGP